MNSGRQGCAVLAGLLLSLASAQAQPSLGDPGPTSSVSGQFVISSVGEAPVFRNLNPDADTNLVVLRPALVAVAAERFKVSIREQLGIPLDAPWSGKIYLRIHPARSLDEPVTISADPFLNRWNYEVNFPDVLRKTRYARALCGVILLEMANQSVAPGGHTAELPRWLVDGLAEQVLETEGDLVVLDAPIRQANVPGDNNELTVSRLNQAKRGMDALARTRQKLQTLPVLTFDDLSWPTDAQMEGADGGAYFASAQFFQYELLRQKDGPRKMRAMLANLPNYYNWQTAFFAAYGQEFKRPLDVEKWWSLAVVNFAARAPGPRWTASISAVRLQQILSVPVDYRNDSNALPAHAETSLQAAIRSLEPAQRDNILRLKARDLALVELQLAPPFGEIADAYRLALEDELGDARGVVRTSPINKHPVIMVRKASVAVTLGKLDALDRRRRDAEARMTLVLPGSTATLPAQ